MLAVLDAARASGVDKVVIALPATAMYGQPDQPRPPGQGGGDRAARACAGWSPRRSSTCSTAYREQHGIEFSALASSSVYGRVSGPRRCRRGPRSTPPDAGRAAPAAGDGRQTPRLRLRRRRGRRDRPRRPARERARWSTSAPACRPRSATSGRPRRPTAPPPPSRRRPPGRVGALQRVVGASPDPPRLGAVDDARRRRRARCADGDAGHGVTGAASVGRASAAASVRRRHHRRLTTARIPAASTPRRGRRRRGR